MTIVAAAGNESFPACAFPAPGVDPVYGWGVVDAARALDVDAAPRPA